jgi:hypothetical protein
MVTARQKTGPSFHNPKQTQIIRRGKSPPRSRHCTPVERPAPTARPYLPPFGLTLPPLRGQAPVTPPSSTHNPKLTPSNKQYRQYQQLLTANSQTSTDSNSTTESPPSAWGLPSMCRVCPRRVRASLGAGHKTPRLGQWWVTGEWGVTGRSPVEGVAEELTRSGKAGARGRLPPPDAIGC